MMPGKHIYEYACVRFVPRVEREEFVNIGVILYCKDKRYLEVRFHLDRSRIEAFAGEVDWEELEAYLHTWNLISTGSREGGVIAALDLPSRFRWLAATRSTVIQSSKVHPGICSQPEKVLADLMEKYVK